ncbi:sensor histidine kinase [Paenibacillus sediminis]|uniref:histidine kinase n=1 Tax=Paenibacillus sediminis TaxID=664909 RepID=A0ABS4H363_9BACL|nr:histidine kinase [Paenibacillus sediminis]MBP1936911.1 signal transduction histidine kinase [Paenibacillus sediminis]
MPPRLNYLRYGLIIIPALLSSFVYHYDDNGIYTLHVLILLSLVALQRFLKSELSELAAIITEISFAAWLATTYGELMLFILISPLCRYLFLPRLEVRLILLILNVIQLNWAYHSEPISWISICNIMLLAFASLIHLLKRSAGHHSEVIHLYDQLRRKHFELDEARNQLIQYAKQVEDAAEAGERQRISRQLHDDIGHRLIRAKMMMEAAIQTMPTQPEQGMDIMYQIRDQLSISMEEMRATVKRLSPKSSPSDAYRLDSLLEEVGRETGIHTQLLTEGIPFPLYPSMLVILYKNAREAITNALRHGNATSIQIKLTYTDTEIMMAVSNNGEVIPQDKPIREQGLGLQGMQERVNMVKGRLEVIWEEPFTVITRLPAKRIQEIV